MSSDTTAVSVSVLTTVSNVVVSLFSRIRTQEVLTGILTVVMKPSP